MADRCGVADWINETRRIGQDKRSVYIIIIIISNLNMHGTPEEGGGGERGEKTRGERRRWAGCVVFVELKEE
jgi:hypothetical protein